MSRRRSLSPAGAFLDQRGLLPALHPGDDPQCHRFWGESGSALNVGLCDCPTWLLPGSELYLAFVPAHHARPGQNPHYLMMISKLTGRHTIPGHSQIWLIRQPDPPTMSGICLAWIGPIFLSSPTACAARPRIISGRTPEDRMLAIDSDRSRLLSFRPSAFMMSG